MIAGSEPTRGEFLKALDKVSLSLQAMQLLLLEGSLILQTGRFLKDKSKYTEIGVRALSADWVKIRDMKQLLREGWDMIRK